MKWPSFGSGNCKPCDSSTKVETTTFPMVPTCPGQESSNSLGCTSNKGKYYDKLTQSLILPLSGQDVKAYVCEPKLWSSCQWVAICYGNNNIAILKVVDIGSDYLNLVNACQDGNEIEDNPPPGTKFAQNTVLYPVPPPWCSTAFCNKLTSAIGDGDCACQGVLDCLSTSSEVCLSSVSELEEGEEVHLFGGTMLDSEGDENADASLWKSCLRKLKEIFTGYNGKSICFSDIPETTTAPDIIDGNPVSKHTVLLDGFGCLRKGPAVTDGSCDEDLDIQTTEDAIHSGEESDEDNDTNSNAKAKVFDALKVCLDGVERVLIPSAACNTIISLEDEDNNKHWEETAMLGRMVFFAVNHVLALGDNVDLKDYAKYRRLAGDCGLMAIVSLSATGTGTSVQAGNAGFTANGVSIASYSQTGTGSNIANIPNAFVPLTENKINITRTTGGTITHGTPVIRLRGYVIGTGEV